MLEMRTIMIDDPMALAYVSLSICHAALRSFAVKKLAERIEVLLGVKTPGGPRNMIRRGPRFSTARKGGSMRPSPNYFVHLFCLNWPTANSPLFRGPPFLGFGLRSSLGLIRFEVKVRVRVRVSRVVGSVVRNPEWRTQTGVRCGSGHVASATTCRQPATSTLPSQTHAAV